MSRGKSSSQNMTRCGKCCHYCRQTATFLFSHIGLCGLLLGYALLGAFAFRSLEYYHEQQLPVEMIKLRANTVRKLSDMTNKSTVLYMVNWTDNAKVIMEEFEKTFVHAVRYKGYDGKWTSNPVEFHCNPFHFLSAGKEEVTSTNSQWSFSGALLYSIIVITTIGYGNVAPRTGKTVPFCDVERYVIFFNRHGQNSDHFVRNHRHSIDVVLFVQYWARHGTFVQVYLLEMLLLLVR